jgi:riboflavin synthase
MFTGIIEELGAVLTLRREAHVARLTLQAELVREDLHIGDSLATNGVCLTVERIDSTALWLTMMPETLQRTTLGLLKPGDHVNLERALRVDSRLGGHLLAGHVDATTPLTKIAGIGEERVYTFALPRELARFIAAQGSIAIDGISLTVVAVTDTTFAVSLIRHTLLQTNLAERSLGSPVNIEIDLIARYLDRLLSARPTTGTVTMARLQELGY